MSKQFAATLLTTMALAAVPAAIAPLAQADICGDVGRRVSVGGCVDPGRDIADAAIVGAAADDPYGYPAAYPAPVGYPALPPGYLAFPSFPGEQPCYMPDGQPYYTPADAPCF